MSRPYSYMTCWVCGKQISSSGGGVNHYRKHVREGVLVERFSVCHNPRGGLPYRVFEKVKTDPRAQ